MGFKPEVKVKLLEALRSGNYKKAKEGTCVLRTTDDCFCVMGVAADLVAPDAWTGGSAGFYHHRGHSSQLADDVRRDMGISLHEEWRLNDLNDDQDARLQFAELADIIEKDY